MTLDMSLVILLVRKVFNKEEVMENLSIEEVELDRCDEKFRETFAGVVFNDPIVIDVWREAWRVRTDDILDQLETKIRMSRLNNASN